MKYPIILTLALLTSTPQTINASDKPQKIYIQKEDTPRKIYVEQNVNEEEEEEDDTSCTSCSPRQLKDAAIGIGSAIASVVGIVAMFLQLFVTK